MQKRLILVSSLGIGCLLLGSVPNASIARVILSETPPTIEHYFGRPWTRMTVKTPYGDRRVTYTYSPIGLRRIFPESTKLKFFVTFEGKTTDGLERDRVESIQIEDTTHLLRRYPERVDRFFEYVFGYQPLPRNKRRLLYDDSAYSGTLHVTTDCMAAGIAMRYEWIRVPTVALAAKFLGADRCTDEHQQSKHLTQRL